MHTPHRRGRTAVGALAVACTALLAACGSSSATGAGSGTATTVASNPTGTSNIEIMGAWARTSAAMQSAGAAYLTIENTGTKADALTKASVAATVAATVEIHETVAADASTATTAMGMGSGTATTAMGMGSGTATTAMGMGSGTATTAMGMGAMTMRPVAKIDVPAKGKVELKPGGYHIMLLELPQPLVKGTTFDLTLTFESGASKTVKVEVRDQA